MNQTKKITQGAMMLAIFGALIIIDRMTTYLFSEFLILIVPAVIIMYSCMHDLKDGMMISVGILIISFLLGNFQLVYLIYVPIGIITGLLYAWGVKKGLDKRTLMFLAMFVFIAGELLATMVVYPLFGFPLMTMIEEFKVSLQTMGSTAGIDYAQIFSLAGIDFSKIIVIMYILSTILTGVMEGFLIHIVSIFLLRRFKIADLGSVNLWDIRPNPPLAYVCMTLVFGLYFMRYINNETLYYGFIVLAVLAAIVLLYYGYIFVILYGSAVLHRNIGGFFVLLCFIFPYLMFVLMCFGFLYAAGPFRDMIERRARPRQ